MKDTDRLKKAFFEVDRYHRSPFRSLIFSLLLIACGLFGKLFSASDRLIQFSNSVGLMGMLFLVFTLIGFFLIWRRT